MNIANFVSATNSNVGRSQVLGWFAALAVSAMMVGSAYSACLTGLVDGTDPDFSIGLFTPNPAHIYVSVTTTCTGSPCTNPPTLTGGSVHLDLCQGGVRKYSGDGTLAAGPAAQTQSVNVSVPISPKVNGVYNVTRSVVAYFSDGTVRSYTHTCSASFAAAAAKSKAAAAKK